MLCYDIRQVGHHLFIREQTTFSSECCLNNQTSLLFHHLYSHNFNKEYSPFGLVIHPPGFATISLLFSRHLRVWACTYRNYYTEEGTRIFEVARAMTSGSTRWRHGSSRSETKYRWVSFAGVYFYDLWFIAKTGMLYQSKIITGLKDEFVFIIKSVLPWKVIKTINNGNRQSRPMQ